ncbi:MAG: hypothetical protein WCY37_03070 [Candidatus Dojkabacteria bacterium]
MSKTANKGFRKNFLFIILIVAFVSLPLATMVFADTTSTQFSHQITEGILSVDIVDGAGNTVVSPSVGFSSVSYSFVAQNTTGTLGTASEKIRVTNATTTAAWSLNIAATGGVSAVWSDGGTNTHPYNDVTSADNGRLTVDPSGATLAAVDVGCTTTDITKGTADTFISGTVNSIDLLTAGALAGTGCRWDLTGVSLTQRIPALQEVATYTLGMTLTAL